MHIKRYVVRCPLVTKRLRSSLGGASCTTWCFVHYLRCVSVFLSLLVFRLFLLCRAESDTSFLVPSGAVMCTVSESPANSVCFADGMVPHPQGQCTSQRQSQVARVLSMPMLFVFFQTQRHMQSVAKYSSKPTTYFVAWKQLAS